MSNFLKNLQNKPEPTKKMIMWVGIFFIMLIIFIFWLSIFPTQTQKTENSEAATNLKNELPNVWQAFKSQINNIQNLWQK